MQQSAVSDLWGPPAGAAYQRPVRRSGSQSAGPRCNHDGERGQRRRWPRAAVLSQLTCSVMLRRCCFYYCSPCPVPPLSSPFPSHPSTPPPALTSSSSSSSIRLSLAFSSCLLSFVFIYQYFIFPSNTWIAGQQQTSTLTLPSPGTAGLCNSTELLHSTQHIQPTHLHPTVGSLPLPGLLDRLDRLHSFHGFLKAYHPV